MLNESIVCYDHSTLNYIIAFVHRAGTLKVSETRRKSWSTVRKLGTETAKGAVVDNVDTEGICQSSTCISDGQIRLVLDNQGQATTLNKSNSPNSDSVPQLPIPTHLVFADQG